MILNSPKIDDNQYVNEQTHRTFYSIGGLRVVEAKIRNEKGFHVLHRHEKQLT